MLLRMRLVAHTLHKPLEGGTKRDTKYSSPNPSHLSHARSNPTIILIAQIAVPMKPPPNIAPTFPPFLLPWGTPSLPTPSTPPLQRTRVRSPYRNINVTSSIPSLLNRGDLLSQVVIHSLFSIYSWVDERARKYYRLFSLEGR